MVEHLAVMKKFIRGLALLPVQLGAVVLGLVMGVIGLLMLPLLALQVKLAEKAFRRAEQEEGNAAEPKSPKST